MDGEKIHRWMIDGYKWETCVPDAVMEVIEEIGGVVWVMAPQHKKPLSVPHPGAGDAGRYGGGFVSDP